VPAGFARLRSGPRPPRAFTDTVTAKSRIDVPDADARTEREAQRAVRSIRIEREPLVPRALGPRRYQVEPCFQDPER
jgi:hypothetical protein